MVQNKAINDDNIASLLNSVNENLSKVEPSDSDNETGDNQEYDHKSDIHQTVNKVMGKWLHSQWVEQCKAANETLAPGHPPVHDVHTKFHQNTLCTCA
jgi:hypothetical protein